MNYLQKKANTEQHYADILDLGSTVGDWTTQPKPGVVWVGTMD